MPRSIRSSFLAVAALSASVASCGIGVSGRPLGARTDGAMETAVARPGADADNAPGGGDTGGNTVSAGTGGASAGSGGMDGTGGAEAGTGGMIAGTGGATSAGSGGAASSIDGGADADGGIPDGPTDKPSGEAGAVSVPVLTCQTGFHLCAGACVSNHSTASCGGGCTPCPVPEGGAATCNGTTCGISCDSGRHTCGMQCAAADNPTACGASCTRCPVDPNGNSQCIGGTCQLQCRPGFHGCGDRCADDLSPAHCGASCDPCPVPTNGRAICVQGRCDTACNPDRRLCRGACIDDATACDGVCPAAHHLCGDTCRPNGGVASCGTLCTPCVTPAGGEATCDGSTCGFRCRPGFHACGLTCPANGRSIACLGTRVVGNPLGYVKGAMEDVIVVRSTNNHVIEMVRSAGGALTTTDLTDKSQGGASANSDFWAFHRSDGLDSLLFRGVDNHLHESSRAWDTFPQDIDLSVRLGLPALHGTSTIAGLVRSDGINCLYYRAADGHLIEVYSNFEAANRDPTVLPWLSIDLTGLLTVPGLAGNPMAFHAMDGWDSIVFRADDGHIHEVRSRFLRRDDWVHTDLNAAAAETGLAGSDPWGFATADGLDAVVYLGVDQALHVLLRDSSGSWTHQLLPAVSPASPPIGFIRSNGRSAVVYRSADTAAQSIHLLTFDGTWTDLSLDALDRPSTGPAGTPFPRVTAQGLDAIVYRTSGGELGEHRLEVDGTWSAVTY